MVYTNTLHCTPGWTRCVWAQNVSTVAVNSFPGSQDAGMYTRSELGSFWDSILISAASQDALKKFSQKLIVFSNKNKNPDSFPYYAPRTDFFVDNMISPGYFKDRFMDTFGPVAYVLEHCGIQKYPLIQLRLTKRPPHLYNLLTIPQLQSQTLLLLPQLDYSSQFHYLNMINLKLQKNFLYLVHFYRTFDSFFHAPITLKLSLITVFLDVNIAVSIILIIHGEQNDLASINIYNTVSNQNSPHGKYLFGIADAKNTRFKAHLYPLNDW